MKSWIATAALCATVYVGGIVLGFVIDWPARQVSGGEDGVEIIDALRAPVAASGDKAGAHMRPVSPTASPQDQKPATRVPVPEALSEMRKAALRESALFRVEAAANEAFQRGLAKAVAKCAVGAEVQGPSFVRFEARVTSTGSEVTVEHVQVALVDRGAPLLDATKNCLEAAFRDRNVEPLRGDAGMSPGSWLHTFLGVVGARRAASPGDESPLPGGTP